MTKKKKILLSVVSVVVVLGIVAGALALYFTRFRNDEADTEELFRQNVEAVGYENTIETAYPMTDVYDIIEAHLRGELSDNNNEKKVVIIGYDGCRADILTKRENSGAINHLLRGGASINLTYCGGVNYPEENTQDTSTAPGWCSMLTGEWADVHGITSNGITKNVEPKTLMTSLVEEDVIDNAAFITKWKGHFSRNNATYLDEKSYCEEHNLDVDFNLRKNNSDVFTGAMEEVISDDCADFVFIIYEDTDSAGHDYGFTINNPAYEKGFKQGEAYGYEVIKAIESRETYAAEDWLIIVTSDHGGIGTDHGGSSIQERMTFVVMNKDWE